MADREKVIRGLVRFIDDFKPFCGNRADWQKVYDALALLREQEARVMTVEEVIHSKDWVWYQWKNTHCGWAIAVNCDGKWIEWEDSTTDQLCKYGEKWRCWTSRPTPEQMRDTKWEDEDDQ